MWITMASLEGFEPATYCLEGRKRVSEMLNTNPVAHDAALSKLSKSYIPQVKQGKRRSLVWWLLLHSSVSESTNRYILFSHVWPN